MGEELEDKDPLWSPITPAKRDSSRIARKKQCGEFEGENGGMPDNLKISKDDDEAPNIKSRTRMRMKRHRPKVLDESRPTKSSTPKPRTPRPSRYVYSRKKSCRKNLDFSKPEQVYEATNKSKIVKRKRMMRKRMSVDKLIGLIRMIHEKISCRCKSAVLELTWERRRLRTFTRRRRLDFSFFKCENVEKSMEDSNELVAKESIEAFFSRDVYKEALVDFATLRMKFLSIVDRKVDLDEKTVSNQLVVWDKEKQKLKPKVDLVVWDEEKQKLKPKVDLDEETLSVWNNLMGKKKGQDNKTKANDEEAHKKTNMEQQRELFRGRVDSFIALMSLLSGDRRFSRWKGSVVDSVVGVFLTQNVSDSLSSSAYMSLAARYPPQFKSEIDEGGMDGNMIFENQRVEIEKLVFGKDEESNHDYQVEVDIESENTSLINKVMHEKDKEKANEKQEGTRGENYADSINWEAVRKASVEELAKVIEERGMSSQLAERIKDFLDRLVKDHGAIDLEWLRDIPPDKAKDYLLSVKGLGLKSTECVRLLSLLQPAFPIDVNAGRVVVRLGWVKLRPLPDSLPFHLLNDYPELAQIQKYLWPRICDRDELTLYELHCYLNIFSKAFCTKSQPNCSACPMRGECKHYASALASSRLHLEVSEEKDMPFESSTISYQEVMMNRSPQYLVYPTSDAFEYRDYKPVVDFPTSPETTSVIPLGGDIEDLGPLGGDIEDLGYEYEYDIRTIILSNKEFFENDLFENEFLGNRTSIRDDDDDHVSKNPPNFVGDDDDVAKAVVALSPHIASIPIPKQKDVQRLRTVHNVYELPDSHPLLAGFREREPEDPCPYLLAIWTKDETTNSSQESKNPHSSNECTGVEACCPGQIVEVKKDDTVEGTILIPCRTANKGRFPLNGTYFQINEVFADNNSSTQSITVPRDLIWNLRRRLLYCGTSITSICKEMSLEEIVYCFQKGFICIRGFDTRTGRSHPLAQKFHLCKSRSSTKQ